MAVNENEQGSRRSVSPEIKGLDLERALAMLRRDDETSTKSELCSSRTGVMPPVDRKEKCSTSDSTIPLPADQNIKQEENTRMLSARIKSEPG